MVFYTAFSLIYTFFVTNPFTAPDIFIQKKFVNNLQI